MPSYEISSEERAALYCLHHDTHIVDRPDEPSNDGSVHATSRLTINGFRHRGEAYDQTGPRASNLGSIRDIFYHERPDRRFRIDDSRSLS